MRSLMKTPSKGAASSGTLRRHREPTGREGTNQEAAPGRSQILEAFGLCHVLLQASHLVTAGDAGQTEGRENTYVIVGMDPRRRAVPCEALPNTAPGTVDSRRVFLPAENILICGKSCRYT